MNDNELSPEERDTLRSLKLEMQPPDRVEGAVRNLLRRDGFFAAPPWQVWRWLAIASCSFAVVMTVALMSSLGSRTGSGPSAVSPRFMMLLYAGDSGVTGTDSDRRREYEAWAREVASRGVAISGEELASEGIDVAPGWSGNKLAPLTEPRGYFVISARDADSAKQIAATCPHLRHGGGIVIRRIVER